MQRHLEDSISADGASHVQSVRNVLPRSSRELVIAIILSISVLVNVACLWKMRDIDTRKWLHDYDLNQFQMGEFRQLQREVDLDHALLERNCKR